MPQTLQEKYKSEGFLGKIKRKKRNTFNVPRRKKQGIEKRKRKRFWQLGKMGFKACNFQI